MHKNSGMRDIPNIIVSNRFLPTEIDIRDEDNHKENASQCLRCQ